MNSVPGSPGVAAGDQPRRSRPPPAGPQATRGDGRGLALLPAGSSASGQQRLPRWPAASRGADPGQPRASFALDRSGQCRPAGGCRGHGAGLLHRQQRLAGLGRSGQLAALLLGLLGFPALSLHAGGPSSGGPDAGGRHGTGGHHRTGPALAGVGRTLPDSAGTGHLASAGGGQSPRTPGGSVRLRQHRRGLAGSGLAPGPGRSAPAGALGDAPAGCSGDRRQPGGRPGSD